LRAYVLYMTCMVFVFFVDFRRLVIKTLRLRAYVLYMTCMVFVFFVESGEI